MTGMEQDRPRPRRSFTPAFKADIVERCRRGDRSIGQVARDLVRSAVLSPAAKQPVVPYGLPPGQH